MVRVKPELGRLIDFISVNLIRDDWPFREPFDVVFCRNVMIYFDGPTQRRVLERIHRVLKPGGMLFVGHAENFSESRDLFTLRGKNGVRAPLSSHRRSLYPIHERIQSGQQHVERVTTQCLRGA